MNPTTLYSHLELLKARRQRWAAVAVCPDTQPRDRHVAEVNSRINDREMETTMAAALVTGRLIKELQKVAEELVASEHASRHWALALVKVEEAVDRLYRELGREEPV